ncbi:hypothetical protein DdX_17743 [Ditylenchus destructor]|uniref:SCP domain-containing protein n=1 Tax=Ditylenchus destructor TaxID=166010 RepID=A0AAD4QVI7_9BILA|nr:hypothetical protein DdX_17743 [Ditylenchus destructor]
MRVELHNYQKAIPIKQQGAALQYAMEWWWGQLADKGFYTPNLVFANEDFQKTTGSQLSVNKPVYKSGPPCTKTSGCVNTPASTCDVESSLCFVGGVPASGK